MGLVKKQFTVCLENKPGQLARLCKALARAKVNILAISVVDSVDSGLVRFVAESAAAARKALAKAKINATTRDVLVVTLANEPGGLAEAAGRLAAAGVNIDYVYASTMRQCEEALCVFAVDDNDKAAKVLA